jgi:hypothetical protein
MGPEIAQLIATLRLAMEDVNRSIGQLVDDVDALTAKDTLEGVRRCLLVINELYHLVDLGPVYRDTKIIDRCHQSMGICQDDLEKVFGPVSQGLSVGEQDLRQFALDWMEFHERHVELTDYIQDKL